MRAQSYWIRFRCVKFPAHLNTNPNFPPTAHPPSFKFGGGVTSLEAFSLCKPVITLPDKQTVPQLTKGMYEHMGMGELVARSLDEFAELAVRVSYEPAVLSTWGILHLTPHHPP